METVTRKSSSRGNYLLEKQKKQQKKKDLEEVRRRCVARCHVRHHHLGCRPQWKQRCLGRLSGPGRLRCTWRWPSAASHLHSGATGEPKTKEDFVFLFFFLTRHSSQDWDCVQGCIQSPSNPQVADDQKHFAAVWLLFWDVLSDGASRFMKVFEQSLFNGITQDVQGYLLRQRPEEWSESLCLYFNSLPA